MRCTIQTLTFPLLDDILLGLQANSLAISDVPRAQASSLGPLIEWHHVRQHIGSSVAHSLESGRFSTLLAILASQDKWFHRDDAKQGFVRSQAIKNDHTNWTEFAMRAKRAATSTGFASDEAGQLVAAIGELHSNIVEHSQRDASGYLVYDVSPNRFEFVVADGGIGVLESLRTHPYFASLQDAGTALELALSEGVSRFHDQKDRGFGFRPLFVGLANISQHIRFRSADHSREITRVADGSIQAATHQKHQLQGFLCSVACEAEQN